MGSGITQDDVDENEEILVAGNYCSESYRFFLSSCC